jgi:hypothetical protein
MESGVFRWQMNVKPGLTAPVADGSINGADLGLRFVYWST